jgi:hypothetical protein
MDVTVQARGAGRRGVEGVPDARRRAYSSAAAGARTALRSIWCCMTCRQVPTLPWTLEESKASTVWSSRSSGISRRITS